MIDEKKLIEDIWKQSNNHTTEWSTGGILALIEKQPQADKCSDCSRRRWYQRGYQDGLNADKWIPCEERLPSEKNKYLVSLEGCCKPMIAYFSTEYKKWYWWNSTQEMRYVIAWQPLPQPYKKEGVE